MNTILSTWSEGCTIVTILVGGIVTVAGIIAEAHRRWMP